VEALLSIVRLAIAASFLTTLGEDACSDLAWLTTNYTVKQEE
jgi:hypothetical protein